MDFKKGDKVTFGVVGILKIHSL